MKTDPKRHESGTRPAASTLGARIRSARQRSGRTQAELAAVLGVPVDEIARVEDGESTPSGEDVQRIAAALDTTVEQLAFAPSPIAVTKRGVG